MSRLSGTPFIVRDAATKLVSDDTAVQTLSTGFAGSAGAMTDIADGLVADATAIQALRLGTAGPIAIGEGTGVDGSDNYNTRTTLETTGLNVTQILIDIDGLASSGDEAFDIIGEGTTANAHFGAYNATWGTIIAGTMECLQLPAGGEIDLDLSYATEGTLAASALLSTGTNIIIGHAHAGNWALNQRQALALFPTAASPYLYLTQGVDTSTDAGTYSAGIFLITFYGV